MLKVYMTLKSDMCVCVCVCVHACVRACVCVPAFSLCLYPFNNFQVGLDIFLLFSSY